MIGKRRYQPTFSNMNLKMNFAVPKKENDLEIKLEYTQVNYIYGI